MLRAGGAVEEVPGLQQPLLAVDEQLALPREHEERFLLRLRVVEAVRLARAEDADVDADLSERVVVALEDAGEPVSDVIHAVSRTLTTNQPSGPDRIYGDDGNDELPAAMATIISMEGTETTISTAARVSTGCSAATETNLRRRQWAT